MAPALLLAGVIVALAVGRIEFLAAMALYYGATLAYSFYLKRKIVVDICALAGLYTIRILAGAAATGVPLSVWLLAFSMFIFLALAAVKRQAELVDAVSTGRLEVSGRGYLHDDLPIVAMMAISSGYVAVLVMALYLDSQAAIGLYGRPELLWGVCPILLYWVSRMVMIAHRGRMDDDPIVFAVKDYVSRWCGVILAVIVGAAILS